MTHLACKRTLVLLDRYLDGDLRPERAALVQAHVQQCAGCRAELEAAQRVQTALRALPRHRCPEGVAAAVREQVERTGSGAMGAVPTRPTRRSWRQLLGDAGWDVVWRPAFATAGVAATALCIALLARQPEHAPVTATELARAEEDVRWALAYVAQVTRRASDAALETTVGEIVGDVIGERVVVPVTSAVRRPLEEDRTP